MGAVRTKAAAGLRRRRLQATVIGAVLFLASSAATIALNTLVESQAPFDHAFAGGNGAHLVVDYDGRLRTAQIEATATTGVVTGSAGPWPIAQVDLVDSADAAKGGFQLFGGGDVSGRRDPDTLVDRVTVSAGRWWQAAGEIVVSQSWAELHGKSVGDTVLVQQAPAPGKDGARPVPANPSGTGGPALASRTLTIVGIAGSISTPRVVGWMSPTDVAALTPDQVPQEQMLYRVNPASTPANLAGALTAITSSLPTGSVSSSQSYLDLKAGVDRTSNLYVPILLAFALFALLAAGFIIANVVSGIVLSSYRDIGVMKAIGYTPAQVVAILLAEILLPVLAGTVLGVTVGTIGSQPILAQTARAFGLPAPFTLSSVVIGSVLAASGATAILAAALPAIRAGRLSAVGATTRGQTPSSGGARGRLRQLALGLPIREPVRLGFAAGVAHPLRALMTLGALVVGVAAVVFAIGLVGSLRVVAADFDRDRASPIRVELRGPGATASDVAAAIASNPDTANFVEVGQADVAIPQLGTMVPFVAYRGDSSWLGYALIEGRWFAGPGEAVAPTNFFTATGLHVGDTTTAGYEGRQITITLVGKIFDPARENRDGLLLRGEWSDLASVDPGLALVGWEVQPAAGTNLEAYHGSIQDATNLAADVSVVPDSATDEGFLLFDGVISLLGLVLVVISLGGVFNTVLLETRQRIRETAILKAVGMTPGQVVIMVVASVVPVGVVAGLIGVPVGVFFQRAVLGFMGQAASQTEIPAGVFDVFAPAVLFLLGLSGLAIGALGAYLPAQRAARSRIATVLQAE